MKVLQIKPNSIINISISTHFYRYIQDLAVYIYEQFKGDEYTQAISHIENDEELSEKESVLKTILTLCGAIEQKAQEQGHTEEVDLPNN